MRPREDRPPRPSASESRSFYEALQELLRLYQFRDRDRACYGTVSPNECYALEAVERSGPLSVGELAAALGLHKSNASRLARGLEARGFLAREPDARDGRAVRLVLTEAGRSVHDAIRAQVEERQAALLARHEPGMRRAFVEILRALAREAAGRIGPAACPPKER